MITMIKMETKYTHKNRLHILNLVVNVLSVSYWSVG